MSKERTKRQEIELILSSMGPHGYSAEQATEELLALLDRKNELRDKFAAAALQGFLASDVCMGELDRESKALGITGAEEKHVQPKVIASTAYLIADAMLRARAA